MATNKEDIWWSKRKSCLIINTTCILWSSMIYYKVASWVWPKFFNPLILMVITTWTASNHRFSTPVFSRVRVDQSSVSYATFCRSLFVFMSFFLLAIILTFLRFTALIIPLVSSNVSWRNDKPIMIGIDKATVKYRITRFDNLNSLKHSDPLIFPVIWNVIFSLVIYSTNLMESLFWNSMCLKMCSMAIKRTNEKIKSTQFLQKLYFRYRMFHIVCL